LLAAIGGRYRASGRAERTKILDEFTPVTGYHRKHAIRLLRPKAEAAEPVPRRVYRRYDDKVRETLIGLWEASDRLCSKRLKPIIPVLLPALERHAQLAINEAIRALMLTISPATIDRLLSEVRLVARGVGDGGPGSARRSGARCLCGRSAIGTTRRRAASRWILSCIPEHRPPAVSCRQWY
jgi:hypothetical protein